jgi:phospholipid/cholesterol/gamma-HCH transport system permease protein
MSTKDLAPIKYTKELIEDIGLFSTFVMESTRWGFRRPFRYEELIGHIEFIGNKSVLIITLTGAFTGMVFSFQVYQGFKIVNAQNLVGPTVALGITRELGPVLVGLIVAARAGGAMAARIGSMRVTEQIDALEVMGVNPKQFLVAPRILAALIAAPLLTALFIYVALIGAHLVAVRLLGLDEAIFLNKVYLFLEPKDIAQGLIKGTVFGFIFATVCTYKGFYTKGGARGVGNATNEGVVLSMVLIIVIDYFLTNFAVMAYRYWK